MCIEFGSLVAVECGPQEFVAYLWEGIEPSLRQGDLPRCLLMQEPWWVVDQLVS